MKKFLELSIEYAAQRSYLDDLYRVYPIIPSGIREVDQKKWDKVESAYQNKNNIELIRALLKMKLFPIKDSYIGFLRKDPSAIERNPATVNRICGQLYEMGLPQLYTNCTAPKETNRQIGPMFKQWVSTGALGLFPVNEEQFLNSKEDAILDASDTAMQRIAYHLFGYKRRKGLDFIGRINSRYVIGEAKFLTTLGGHQNAQFEDAINTVRTSHGDAVSIAILDGVLYIPSKDKLYQSIIGPYSKYNIMSALVLREFLYTL